MADTLGNVAVPTVPTVGTFPLTSKWGFGQVVPPDFVVHRFESGNTKIEQRFKKGNGAIRHRFIGSQLNEAQRVALRNFWETQAGGYGQFTYNKPSLDGSSSTAVTARFANPELAWAFVSNFHSNINLDLVEVPADADAPTYSIAASLTRFPDSTLTPALLAQDQELIPLISIQPRAAGYPSIYVSDRRCTVGSQLYQPRLVKWGPISQNINGQSDDAPFVFGNADRVMTALMNDTNLRLAWITFSLFHVGTGIKLDLWAGEIKSVGPSVAGSAEFPIVASDPSELLMPTPQREVSHTCPWHYNDGNNCKWTELSGHTLPNLTLTMANGTHKTFSFTPDAAECDYGLDTPNGCMAHDMMPSFGGQYIAQQGIGPKDKVQQGLFTSSSVISDTAYGKPLKRIYTEVDMPVQCDVISVRDEGEADSYLVGLGIVGAGPLTAFGTDSYAKDQFGVGNKIDGQYAHGFNGGKPLSSTQPNPKSLYGMRQLLGHHPAWPGEYFSLGEGGGGIQTNDPIYTAGVAALEIRRTGTKDTLVLK